MRFDALWTPIHVSAGLHPMSSPLQSAWTARQGEFRDERAFPGEESALGLGQERQVPLSEVPGERGNVGVTQTLRGLGTGCDSWDSSALEEFCRVFRENRKQGNGWKESREMQIWTPYGSVQNQDGFLVYCLLSKAGLRQP